MALKTKKIPVSQLQVGMYVCELDCPWTETPYPLQGFYVSSQRDLDKVAHYSENVVIDLEWTQNSTILRTGSDGGFAVEKEPQNHWARADAGSAPDDNVVQVEKPKPKISVLPIKVDHHRYKDSSTLAKELPVAVEIYGELTQEVAKISAALRDGQRIETRKVAQLARGMVQSVVRNPDAFVWLARIKAHDKHSYDHSLACSIWAVVFGRRIGLAAQDLENLTIAALFSKIGITKVPKSVLTKPGPLSDTEKKIFQKFVEYGAAEIKMMPGIDPQVAKIVEYHRERHDGSGFPKHCYGDKISESAKLLGLVDYFEELISPRLKAPLDTAAAVSKLYETRDRLFQGDLVEEFIRAVGVYPAGTLVELTTSEVGVIVKHNPERRLRPQVMMLLDSAHRPLKKVRMVDLMKTLEDRTGRPLHIDKALPHGSYGIKPDQYMNQVVKANTGWKLWAR